MKNALLAFGLLGTTISSGCTTLHLSDGSTDEMRRQIATEGFLKPGDTVRLITTDKAVHEFRVTEINLDTGVVSGKHESVPVSEIVGLGTREFAVWKTVGLAIGIVGTLQLNAAADDAAAQFHDAVAPR